MRAKKVKKKPRVAELPYCVAQRTWIKNCMTDLLVDSDSMTRREIEMNDPKNKPIHESPRKISDEELENVSGGIGIRVGNPADTFQLPNPISEIAPERRRARP